MSEWAGLLLTGRVINVSNSYLSGIIGVNAIYTAMHKLVSPKPSEI